MHCLDIVDEGGTGSVTKHAVAQVLDRLGCSLSAPALDTAWGEMQATQHDIVRQSVEQVRASRM